MQVESKIEESINNDKNESSIAYKYKDLKRVIVANFDERVWFLADACLSVIATLGLKDQQNPVGLNIIGPASSEKTTVLSFFYGNDDLVYHSDNFTPASFVSHSANTKKAKLVDVDMLPKIKGKCLIIPELAPIFGTNKDELLRNFSVLTRVFDGEGLTTNSGVHGQRGYEGDYYFAWLGASTPIRKAVWNIMGQLGSRLLFLSLPSGLSVRAKQNKMLEEFFGREAYRDRVNACQVAVRDFLEYFMAQFEGEGPNRYYRAVDWERHTESKDIVEQIIKLSSFTVRARQAITNWNENHSGRTEVNYSQPIPEEPDRLFSVLYGLARGHAILSGRKRLTSDDMPLITEIALSTMPDDRRDTVELLLSEHPDKSSGLGSLTSSELTSIKKISKPKALRIFEKIAVLGLVTLDKSEGPGPSRIKLIKEFDWLLSGIFQKNRFAWQHRQNFDPELPF
ncbi:MAG: hypothetical protein ABIE07_01480 [Candidatus Zixiibacteriota bacterium]